VRGRKTCIRRQALENARDFVPDWLNSRSWFALIGLKSILHDFPEPNTAKNRKKPF